MTKFILLTALVITLSMKAESPAITFKSTQEQTALLELYTSEGCSSCPPAEAWLSRLKESPGLWKDFVPVAFHVDYWDQLGWRDPFADRAFSDRQLAYAEFWHSENVYTPEFVLNGKEWRCWPTRQDVPKPPGMNAGVLKVSSSDVDRWHVSFQPVGTAEEHYEVHAALLSGGLSSDVKAGENRGRRLSHDFAAVAFATVPMKQSGGIFLGQFVLSSRTNNMAGNAAIAVWITRAGTLESVQATGGWIVRPPAGR
jgi:hypothetical protein